MATQLRKDILTMSNAAGSGHVGGALGMADVFAVLYFSKILHYDPYDAKSNDRDRVILSNAHICPVYYASLAHAGYFPTEELLSFRKFGSRLQGHPNTNFDELPVETSGGPLGQGMSVAVGKALALKLKSRQNKVLINSKVYCICSDGELNEGQAWEAMMAANKFCLSNLVFILDRNNAQIDGNSDDVMPLEPLHEKMKSFGMHVIDVDGHDINKIYNALKNAETNKQPSVLIMHTILGKGVSFMENDFHWHGKAPNDIELQKAIAELY